MGFLPRFVVLAGLMMLANMLVTIVVMRSDRERIQLAVFVGAGLAVGGALAWTVTADTTATRPGTIAAIALLVVLTTGTYVASVPFVRRIVETGNRMHRQGRGEDREGT